MIHFYKDLVDKGYSEDAAYQKMVEKYMSIIEERKSHFRVVNNLKVTNGFRSLLDVYQQKAEYEARLKVNRMRRDLMTKEFLEKNELPDYERNVKIVNRKTDSNPSKMSEKDHFTDFFSRSKRLLKAYYEKAYVRDRLDSLTDKEILYTIRETPTKIKKACKGILSQIEKNNITIKEDGSLDFSRCENPFVIRKLENNPMVKYALLQESLDYGFVHLTTKKKVSEDIKRELLTQRAADIRQEEEDTKEERELELKKQANQSEIDKKIGFISAGGFARTGQEDEGGRRFAEPADLIEGTEYRTDQKGVLLESFPERLLRLEKRWLRERMASIEGGVENLDEEEIAKKLQELTEKVRRVKMQVDRQAMAEAQEMMFEEHSFLTFKEMMTEKTPIERLLNYYSLPVDQRQPGLVEDQEFSSIRAMIKRKEIVEDLVAPFDLDANSQLEYEDTQDMREASLNRPKKERDFDRFSGNLKKGEDLESRTNQATSDRGGTYLKEQERRKVSDSKKKQTILEKVKQRVQYGEDKRKSLGIMSSIEAEGNEQDETKGIKGGRIKNKKTK